ncbi:MAG: tRNA (adenosine(37)-N6)-dimethylallyltransferase MiaA [Candidatus Paceibacterota bacterium]|jgi:tRNA dimethylallyltransferase
MKKVYVILGQTATGKSALAVSLAKEINGEIVSADSRQIYEGLDIGSGKITKKEMRGVPHHLLDIVSPKRRFSVAEYQKLALVAIKDIIERGKTPIVCGGTGFYVDAITLGTIFPEVPPNKALRKLLEGKSLETLFNLLNKIDPKRAKSIDVKNKVRIIRAIEVAKYLGKVPVLRTKPPPYKFIKIGLYLPPDKLRLRIEKRMKKMFASGLLDEITKLKKSGVSNKRLREFGFEYNEPTIEKVVQENIKYARRQMTWFKRDKRIKWLDASKEIDPKLLF